MSTPRKYLLATLTLAVGAAATILVLRPTAPQRWHNEFVRHIAQADRVVVDLNVWPAARWPGVSIPRYETRDPNALQALAAAIQVERAPAEKCACYGVLRFDLFRGNQLLDRASLHHGTTLNLATLTPASRAALDTWLTQHGCPTAAQAEVLQTNRFIPATADQAASIPATRPAP